MTKLTAVKDAQLASHFDWGAIQFLVSGEMMPGSQMTFGYVEIEAGQKNPRHMHPNSDEVLYLIEGELQHSVGEENFHLTAGMAIFIPQQAAHDAQNTGTTTARMVVAYNTGDRQMVLLEAGQEI